MVSARAAWSASNEVKCDRSDFGYAIMYDAGRVFICLTVVLFLVIVSLIKWSFEWQYGNRIRDSMPIPVAIVEMATF